MKGLPDIYVQQFKTTLASFLQYRAAIVIWMIGHVLEPLIYLVVWSAVAASRGSAAWAASARGDFAAYFIVMMLVNHATYTWIMYEFEYRVRHGSLSFALLRPLHPIHTDIVDNVSSKLITLPLMLVAAGILAAVFKPVFHIRSLGGRGLRPGAIPRLSGAVPDRVDAGPGRLLDDAGERRQPGLLRGGAVSLGAGRAAGAASRPGPGRGDGPAVPLDDQLSRGVAPRPADARRGAHRARRRRPSGSASALCFCGSSGGRACGSTRRWAHEITSGCFGSFFRVSVLGELAYRANFFLQLFESLLDLGTALAGLAVIFSYTRHSGRLAARRGAGAGRRLLPGRAARSAW